MALAPGRRVLSLKRIQALVLQKERHLILIFNMDILSFWSTHPFLQ